MSLHTMGPWRKQRGYVDPRGFDIVTDEERAQYIAHVDSSIPRGERNACLIASSPELLLALEDAEFLLRKAAQVAGPMQDSFKRSAEDARTAIAKAKGIPA